MSGMLMVGEVVRVGAWGYKGTLLSTQFCYEPKTALKDLFLNYGLL